MGKEVLDALQAQVTKSTTVMDSATALIKGIAARIQAAIDAALGKGATEAELAPVQAEVDALSSASDALAAAVEENT